VADIVAVDGEVLPTELRVVFADDEEEAERSPVGRGPPATQVAALLLTVPPEPEPVE